MVEAIPAEIDSPGAGIPLAKSEVHVLVSGHLIARNTVVNLLGQAAPMAIGLVAMPRLIAELGTTRFGVIALSWVILGYFGVFDLGLGRALTKLVAENAGTNAAHIKPLVWTAMTMMAALGMFAALVMLAIIPRLVRGWLTIPSALRTESAHAFTVLAFAIPVVLLATGFRGILEAQQRFGFVNAVRLPTNALSFLAPLAVATFSHALTPIVISLVAIRICAGVAYFIGTLRSLPMLGSMRIFDRSKALPLLRFGGWMTVSNIVGPVMSYLDRFIIGGLLTLDAVTYYATPYDAVMNLAVIPGAITGVLFPAFSATLTHEPNTASWFFLRGLKYIFIAMFPIALAVFAFAPEGLRWWLGANFAMKSTPVLRWLALGLFVNSLGFVPFALVQGAGRPDLTAKLHFLELPGYLLLVLTLLRSRGIEGVAMAWFIRAAVDCAVLLSLSVVVLPATRKAAVQVFWAALAAVTGISVLSVLGPVTVRLAVTILTTAAFVGFVWIRVLSREERRWIGTFARRLALQSDPN